jgi:hypothetical protein
MYVYVFVFVYMCECFLIGLNVNLILWAFPCTLILWVRILCIIPTCFALEKHWSRCESSIARHDMQLLCVCVCVCVCVYMMQA